MAIPRVAYEYRGISQGDSRRLLLPASGDLEDFIVLQTEFEEDSSIAGHFHDNDEWSYLFMGFGIFTLKDINTGVMGVYPMMRDDKLFIPKGIAHKATFNAGSVLIRFIPVLQGSAEPDDRKYDF